MSNVRSWKEVEDEHLMKNPDVWGKQDNDENFEEIIKDMGVVDDDDEGF